MLQTLVAIADTGTVTAAADRLAYTQSTVSMQLHRLEALLEVSLHEREGRRIRFTAEGEQLIGYARKMLALNKIRVVKTKNTNKNHKNMARHSGSCL